MAEGWTPDKTPVAWLDEAKAKAREIAPPATYGAGPAGALGLIITWLIIGIFCVIAGLPFERFQLSAFIVGAVGFAGPFLYYRTQANRHLAEYVRLCAEADERAKNASEDELQAAYRFGR